ncbi:MAG: oligosaccharide flippase family protein [Nitrospirae bacterium]|nr:oligosaccharide flippase family protein [Nitrospirota bacterium]
MDKQELLKKGSKAAYYTFIFKIGSQFASLVITILLVRFLSEHDYGVYNLLYSTIGIIGIVASFGLSNTLQRFIPEYYQKGEFMLAHRLYETSSFIRLVSNILIIALLILFWDLFAVYLKIEDYKNYFLLFSFILVLYMQWGLVDVCLSSYFLHKYTQGMMFVLMIIKLIGYLIAFYLGINLSSILLVDLLGYVILFITLQLIYTKKIPKNEGQVERFTPDEKKRVQKYALYYNFNDIGVQFLDLNIDNFTLAYFLNPVAVGAYAFCNRIAKTINRFLPTTYLIEVIRPLLFSAYSTRKDSVTPFYQFMIKIIYLFYVPIFVFFLVFSKDIITVVFGGKYLEYSYVLVSVIFFQMISAFQIPLGLIAQLQEKVEIILFSKIFGIYNLIADIIMIKWWGIMGAVVATGSAVFLRNIFIWWFTRNTTTFKGLRQYFIRAGIYAVTLYAIFMISKSFINSVFFSLIIGLVFMILSFIIYTRVTVFSAQERSWLANASHGKYQMKILQWLGIIAA